MVYFHYLLMEFSIYLQIIITVELIIFIYLPIKNIIVFINHVVDVVVDDFLKDCAQLFLGANEEIGAGLRPHVREDYNTLFVTFPVGKPIQASSTYRHVALYSVRRYFPSKMRMLVKLINK